MMSMFRSKNRILIFIFNERSINNGINNVGSNNNFSNVRYVLLGNNSNEKHAADGKILVRRNLFKRMKGDILNQKTVTHQRVAALKLWHDKFQPLENELK